MSWTLLTNTTTPWTVLDAPSSVTGRVLYAGMSMGLLLALTYNTNIIIGWPDVSTNTTTWTLVATT